MLKTIISNVYRITLYKFRFRKAALLKGSYVSTISRRNIRFSLFIYNLYKKYYNKYQKSKKYKCFYYSGHFETINDRFKELVQSKYELGLKPLMFVDITYKTTIEENRLLQLLDCLTTFDYCVIGTVRREKE